MTVLGVSNVAMVCAVWNWRGGGSNSHDLAQPMSES